MSTRWSGSDCWTEERTEERTDVVEQTKGLRQVQTDRRTRTEGQTERRTRTEGQTERRTRTEGQTDGRTARFEYGSLGFIERNIAAIDRINIYLCIFCWICNVTLLQVRDSYHKST